MVNDEDKETSHTITSGVYSKNDTIHVVPGVNTTSRQVSSRACQATQALPDT